MSVKQSAGHATSLVIDKHMRGGHVDGRDYGARYRLGIVALADCLRVRECGEGAVIGPRYGIRVTLDLLLPEGCGAVAGTLDADAEVASRDSTTDRKPDRRPETVRTRTDEVIGKRRW